MGQVAIIAPVIASIVAAVASAVVAIVKAFENQNRIAPNPVVNELETRSGDSKRAAEQEQERTEQEHEQAVIERQAAMERQQRAEEEAARARERAREAEQERQLAEQASQRAREEQSRAEEGLKIAGDQRLVAQHAQMLAEEARQRAEQQQHQEQLAREEAERTSAAAAQAAAEARAAQVDAERMLREGIRPVLWPTENEIRATKERLNYQPEKLHFAVAGIAGSGKSSFINALRGIANSHRDAAPVGVVETTMHVSRYPDPDRQKPFVWYDIPGAGTLSIPDWQYFNDHGLYVFDSIIVLFDNRFTATDAALLRNARRFNIPTYIVRSKSLQHIKNLLSDKASDGDGEGVNSFFGRTEARDAYIAASRASVASNLTEADLPQQKVYLIDAKQVLLRLVQGRNPAEMIDEGDLLLDVLAEARSRRVRPNDL